MHMNSGNKLPPYLTWENVNTQLSLVHLSMYSFNFALVPPG
jgi:hypothetical protein